MEVLCRTEWGYDLIPVQPQPEPIHFDQQVRRPGQAFLQDTPNPNSREWRDYWTRVGPDMYEAYRGVCSYSAQWIPFDVGVPTIDHFVPKAINPALAYEWANYRLAAHRFNSIKRNHQDVLDPFTLQNDWFVLDFPSLLMRPNAILDPPDTNQVEATINRLKLNNELSIKARQRWVMEYIRGEITFDYLRNNAPFIAYELHRQNLENQIAQIMRP